MNQSMPFLQAALLCEGVKTDEYGRHTIINEFSQYTMGYSQPFTIFTVWRGSEDKLEESFKEKIEIIAPDGRVVASGENGPFSLKDNTYRQVNSLLLENVDFTFDGVYELTIHLVDSHNSILAALNYPISVI